MSRSPGSPSYSYGGNRRGRIIILAGLVLAALAFGGIFQISQSAKTSAAIPMTDVLVAGRDLPARTTLGAGDLVLRTLPADASNAVALTKPADAIGKLTAVPLAAGELITPNLLGTPDANAAGASFTILAPGETITATSPAWRAVSVSIPDERAVGGLVTPGAHVDVILTVPLDTPPAATGTQNVATPQGATDAVTKITFQDMLVLYKTGTSYIVRADAATAEQIAHLQASVSGQFSLALRPDADSRTLDLSQYGTDTPQILHQYGFPTPK